MLAQGERMNRIHPGQAMDIYKLALKVIEDLAPSLPEPPHELRATVWKNIAWTLRSFGEFAEAEAALDTAEQSARACDDRGSMLARLKLSRAIHLTSLERWDEALQLVTESRATFREIGDSDRYAMTFDQEANILLYRKDGAAAVPILKRLMKETVDDETRARRSLNLAIAYELAGDLKSALSTLKKAQTLHESLGWTHELTKDRWALGRILAKAGAIDEALETLEQASLEFRGMGDADNVVAVDLERCAIEIENEQHGEATFDRLRAVASYAIEKRLPQSECRALLFLQQLGPSAKLTHIRYVKDFIADLPRHPHREFSPPGLAA
jgi:tetratricopeptide (TPR) repeat protein